MEVATNAAIVIALVDALKRVVGEKLSGLVTIVAAIVIGAALGFFTDGNALQGAAEGLIAVGAITTARAF